MKLKFYAFSLSLSLFFHSFLSAQSEETLPPPDQSFWQTLTMIGIAFMFFYVILWRPEQKRRKALEQQRNSLKKGDRIVIMGIIGTLVQINEHTVIVKMVDGTSKIEFYKAAITDVLSDEPEKA